MEAEVEELRHCASQTSQQLNQKQTVLALEAETSALRLKMEAFEKSLRKGEATRRISEVLGRWRRRQLSAALRQWEALVASFWQRQR